MNREQFLKTFRKSKKITVDGHDLHINEITMAQRNVLMDVIADKTKKNDLAKFAMIVCMSLDCFDENDPEDIKAVSGMGESVIMIADEVLNLSGLGDESAEKNS